MRNVRQHLACACGCNALGIPIAAGIFYPMSSLMPSPVFAGAALAQSLFSVVANALRLDRVTL